MSLNYLPSLNKGLLKRQVFYSFHYKNDNWRVGTIRSIGSVIGNKPAPDNDWENVKKKDDVTIQNWIYNQMKGRSCMVLLIGSETAGRKWINYEIKKAWELNMGIVGIYIHNIKNTFGEKSLQGLNPFTGLQLKGVPFENIVRVYNPPYSDSKDVYRYISENIQKWTNEAVEIRKRY